MQTTAEPAKEYRKRKPRRAHRRRSALPILVRYLGMQTEARLFDISTAGAAIDLSGPFMGVEGSNIRIECTEFCFLEARIRWIGKSRIGVEFDPTSNSVAKVNAYFKFFHKDPMVQTA